MKKEKSIVHSFLICFVLLSCSFIASAKQEEVPVMQVPYIAANPVIDGEFDEKCWQEAAVIENFVSHQRPDPTQQQTRMKLFYNDHSFYFAFECFDNQMNNLKNMSVIDKFDGALWGNDCVEIYIGSVENPHQYYQFIVNWAGTAFDSFVSYARAGITSARWNTVWQRAVTLKEDSWQVEIAIPFYAINLPADSTEIKANFFREKYNSPGEYSAWSSTYSQLFSVPERFGILKEIKLPKRDINILEQETKWPLYLSAKDNIISTTLTSKALENWQGSFLVGYYYPGMDKVEQIDKQSLQMKPGEWKGVAVRFDWLHKNDAVIVFGIQEKDSTTVDWQIVNTILLQDAFVVSQKPAIIYENAKAFALCVINDLHNVKKVVYELSDEEEPLLSKEISADKEELYFAIETEGLPVGFYKMTFHTLDVQGNKNNKSEQYPLWIRKNPF